MINARDYTSYIIVIIVLAYDDASDLSSSGDYINERKYNWIFQVSFSAVMAEAD